MQTTDTLHRAHCTLCAEEDGQKPLSAAHFVEELYKAYAPRYATTTLPRLLTGTYRTQRTERNEQDNEGGGAG